jgi:cytochrome c-type biogenesis protein CcmH/NrfG
MSHAVKGNRRRLILVTLLAVLLVGGAAALWAKTRLFPDPTADARAAYSRGEWGRAALLALRRLKEAPDDREALRLAARAAARQDQDEKAIALYRRLAAENRDVEDFFLLGRSYVRLDQIEPAYGAFEAALKRDSKHAETLAGLSALFARNDRFYAAADAAERLARQPASEARALVMLGRIRAEVQDPAGAARALRRALEIDPQGQTFAPLPAASVRMLLAGSLLRSGRPSEARAVLEATLRAGADPEASWLLSRSFMQERDWGRAETVLQANPSYRAEHPIEPEPAPYVGEARCAGCHREQFDAVLASRHASTFARARELGSLPWPRDPLPDPGNPQVTHQFRREGDSLVVETHKDDRVLWAVLDYAFGSRDHFTTFVGRDHHGRSFMLRMSYYQSPRGTGWDLTTGLPLRPADHHAYLGKQMFARDGVRRCVMCHTTDFHSILNETGPQAADHSIGCERCHGPGGHHLAAVAAGFSDLAIVSPDPASPAVADPICEKCHGSQQPPGLNIPRTDPVWLRFQSLTLPWSRCYTESPGALGCVTCHDPHRNAETSVARNEAKCLSCHAPEQSANPAGSSPSPAPGQRTTPSRDRPVAQRAKSCSVNSARGCIECHMPRIWVQSTHSFKTDHFIRVRNQERSESQTPAVH